MKTERILFWIAVLCGAMLISVVVLLPVRIDKSKIAGEMIVGERKVVLSYESSDSGSKSYYLRDEEKSGGPQPLNVPPLSEFVGINEGLQYFLFKTEDSRLIAVSPSGESHVLRGSVLAVLDCNAEFSSVPTVEIVTTDGEVELYNSYLNAWLLVRELGNR